MLDLGTDQASGFLPRCITSPATFLGQEPKPWGAPSVSVSPGSHVVPHQLRIQFPGETLAPEPAPSPLHLEPAVHSPPRHRVIVTRYRMLSVAPPFKCTGRPLSSWKLGAHDEKGAVSTADLKLLPPPASPRDQAGGPGSSPAPPLPRPPGRVSVSQLLGSRSGSGRLS